MAEPLRSLAEPVRSLAELDLVGGNIGLDFANTINSRFAPTRDYLGTYDGLVAWAERADVVPVGTSQALLERAAGDPAGTARVLQRAYRLRDAIYRTFSAIATGASPADDDVRTILSAYGSAVARGSLDDASGKPTLRWSVGSGRSDVLDPVAYAAGELLLAADRPPVKECPGCGWLFVDRSRNSSRRWCDMQTCGSREKMRRFYRSRRSIGEGDRPRDR